MEKQRIVLTLEVVCSREDAEDFMRRLRSPSEVPEDASEDEPSVRWTDVRHISSCLLSLPSDARTALSLTDDEAAGFGRKAEEEFDRRVKEGKPCGPLTAACISRLKAAMKKGPADEYRSSLLADWTAYAHSSPSEIGRPL